MCSYITNEIVSQLIPNMDHTANQQICNQSMSSSNSSRESNTNSSESSDDFSEHEFEPQINKNLTKNNKSSYFNNLINNYLKDASVFTNNLQGVSVEKMELKVVVHKGKEHIFQFEIKTCRNLKSMALLDQLDVSDFSLVVLECQSIIHPEIKYQTRNFTNHTHEWHIKNDKEFKPYICLSHMKIYRILVKFHAKTIYGKFQENIVFDFGDYPILIQHIEVDVVANFKDTQREENEEKVGLFIKTYWDKSNAIIIPFVRNCNLWTDMQETRWDNSLKEMYSTSKVNQYLNTEVTFLNKSNYKNVMHSALAHEEKCRFEKINCLNHRVTLQVIKDYVISDLGHKYSVGGELYALMPLDDKLSEDSIAGKLIVRSCFSVLLVTCDQNIESVEKVKAYESVIEDKTKNVLYLRLSEQFVDNYNLMASTTIDVYIQFQLNRLAFCEWHYAIDQINNKDNISYLFPSVPANFKLHWSPKLHFSTYNATLNTRQKEAVIATLTPSRNLQTSPTSSVIYPIVLLGPFGTGKTYTFSVAIKTLLLDTKNDNKILLCTHSNSAADLYILEYLDKFFELHKEKFDQKSMLRIYYRHRNTKTVSPIVQKYCKMNDNRFVTPTLEEIMGAKIIITTLSTSFILSMLKLQKGFFSHIFIDEAAQIMECESLIPISLSNRKTRIILAGDHMQINPEMYSDEARSSRIHFSLLKRLQVHYPEQSTLKITLQENFRSHEVIAQFTSQLFYNNQLITRGGQIKHSLYHPLTFFTAKGEEVFEENSTNYHNDSEVYEIVEQVIELRNTWPVNDWGEFNENSIGVITPYFNQVIRIRKELRNQNLNNVSVERIFNVQGKEFRVVILSTVRTWKTCNKNCSEDYAFLSDSKILNTAFTRARSLIIVVGDPVALCTIGECRKIWEKYLYSCHINKSFYGMTWKCLKLSLDYLEYNKQFPLNPAAREFYPREFSEHYDQILNSNLPETELPFYYRPLMSTSSQYPYEKISTILLQTQFMELLTSDLLPKGHTWSDMLKQSQCSLNSWCENLRVTFGDKMVEKFLLSLEYFKKEEERYQLARINHLQMRVLGLSRPLYLR